MSVFLNCILRAHNYLTGGDNTPPDCCGDFDGGGPDEPVDDGGGECNYSEACYFYCTRSTQTSIGTTTIEQVCITFDDLKGAGLADDDDCTGPNNTYVFPPVVPDGTVVGEFIMSLIPNGTPFASQAMAPEECTTFDCDAGLCPDNTTVVCPGNGCQTVPNHVTGIFKCSPALPPGTCYDDCASYYVTNPPGGPGGNYYNTAQDCINSGECCVEDDPGDPPTPTTPGQGPQGPATPDAGCSLWTCNETIYECERETRPIDQWLLSLGLSFPGGGSGPGGRIVCNDIKNAAAAGVAEIATGKIYYRGASTCNQNCNEPSPECDVTICINYQDQVNAECQLNVTKTANEWAGILGVTCPAGNCECEDINGILPTVVGNNRYSQEQDCNNCPPPPPPPEECELNVCRNVGTSNAYCEIDIRPVNQWVEFFLLTGTNLTCDDVYDYVTGGKIVNGDRYTVLPCTDCDPVVDPNPITYLEFSQEAPYWPQTVVVMRDPDAGIAGGNPGQFMNVVPSREPRVCCDEGTSYIDVEGFDENYNSLPILFDTIDITDSTFGAVECVEPVPGTNKMRVTFVSCPINEPTNPTPPLFTIKVSDANGNFIQPTAYRFIIDGGGATAAVPICDDCIDANEIDYGADPWNAGGGNFCDPGGGGGPGGGGQSGNTPPPNDGRFVNTAEGQIRREYTKNVNLNIEDRDLNNNFYRRSRKFIPEKNKSYRTDLFKERVHYALEAIADIRSQRTTQATDLPFGELTYDNIENSLVSDISRRLSQIKNTRQGKKVRNDILSSIHRHIIEGTVNDISIPEIRKVLFDFEDPDVPLYTGKISESGAVTHAFENKVSLNYANYGSDIEREKMRLWKTVAPDVDKHLLVVLSNGDQERVFIDQNDKFDLSLSDGSLSTLTISPGDVYQTAITGGLQIPLQFDRDRVSTLNFNDIEKIFGMLNVDYDIVLDVSSDEANLVEKDADLSASRPEVYVLKLNTESLEDLERPHELIRVSKATYEVMNYEDVDDWMSYNPFPFNTFYVSNEDPFLDHLEDSNTLRATFKDFSLDAFVGYNDEVPIFPRRIPWTIAIVPTDREDLQTGFSRSTFVSLSERRMIFKRNLIKRREGLENPILDTEVVGYGEGAVPTAQTDSQVAFKFNSTKIKNTVRPYRNDAEVLPRKASPVRTLLTALENSKTSGEFIDARTSTVPWPTILGKMSISDRKLLITEALDYKKLRSSLSLNRLATKESVKELFPKVSFVPTTTKDATINNYIAPPTRTTKLEGDYETETPEPFP
jgi:hypothetical protein